MFPNLSEINRNGITGSKKSEVHGFLYSPLQSIKPFLTVLTFRTISSPIYCFRPTFLSIFLFLLTFKTGITRKGKYMHCIKYDLNPTGCSRCTGEDPTKVCAKCVSIIHPVKEENHEKQSTNRSAHIGEGPGQRVRCVKECSLQAPVERVSVDRFRGPRLLSRGKFHDLVAKIPTKG
jgi:hypothetical protein